MTDGLLSNVLEDGYVEDIRDKNPSLPHHVQVGSLWTWHHKGDIVVPMAGKAKRLSVALDHRILAEARRLTHSRSKRATIAKALEELVKLEHRKALAQALGTGLFQTTEAEFRSRRRRTHARP